MFKQFNAQEPLRLRYLVALVLTQFGTAGFTLSAPVAHNVKIGVDVAIWLASVIHVLVCEWSRLHVQPAHGKHSGAAATVNANVRAAVTAVLTNPDAVLAEIQKMRDETAALHASATAAVQPALAVLEPRGDQAPAVPAVAVSVAPVEVAPVTPVDPMPPLAPEPAVEQPAPGVADGPVAPPRGEDEPTG